MLINSYKLQCMGLCGMNVICYVLQAHYAENIVEYIFVFLLSIIYRVKKFTGSQISVSTFVIQSTFIVVFSGKCKLFSSNLNFQR